MKFKAKLSPKQFFSFKGTRHQAQNGFFITEDPKLIAFLKDEKRHFAWVGLKEKKDTK